MIYSTAVKFLWLFSACKILGTTTADRKLELGHIAPVHSTTCVSYPDRLLPQNTIYLINKSLLNTKIHLPAWQQLTDCETSVNPDQTFCFWVLLADVMRLLRNGRCACLAGSDMRSSQVGAGPIFSGHVRVNQWSDFFGRGPIFSGHRSWNVWWWFRKLRWAHNTCLSLFLMSYSL